MLLGIGAVARGRCGDPRQNEFQQVGELPVDTFNQWLEWSRRTD
jgi:hypothetical protein